MELTRCLRYALPLAVLIMDLDRFKAVNDTHGHLIGSHVLSEVGRLIRESIRTADVAARYGGEEFVAYLSETSLIGAAQAAARSRMAIAGQPLSLDGTHIPLTLTTRIAACPQHGRDIRSLVGRADPAV